MFIRKSKKLRRMEKWQIGNSENPEISKILEILFRVFSFLSFQFCPIAKTGKYIPVQNILPFIPVQYINKLIFN